MQRADANTDKEHCRNAEANPRYAYAPQRIARCIFFYYAALPIVICNIAVYAIFILTAL
jgi:hypothetical protein